MDARLNYQGNAVAMKFAKYLISAGKVVSDSALPTATQHLVEIRASQINGCAYCTDMHTKDAAHAGETPVRLNLVAAWREATSSPQATTSPASGGNQPPRAVAVRSAPCLPQPCWRGPIRAARDRRQRLRRWPRS
jgi:AhpD family alkylhydroperoxidase